MSLILLTTYARHFALRLIYISRDLHLSAALVPNQVQEDTWTYSLLPPSCPALLLRIFLVASVIKVRLSLSLPSLPHSGHSAGYYSPAAGTTAAALRPGSLHRP